MKTESNNKGQTIHRFACCALRGFNNKQDRKQDRQHCGEQQWFFLDSNSLHANTVVNTEQCLNIITGWNNALFIYG